MSFSPPSLPTKAVLNALAAGKVPAADAELIAVCEQIVVLHNRLDKLFATRNSVDEEQRTKPALDALNVERERLLNRMSDLPDITTMEAARAVARVALTEAARDEKGELVFENDAEWLALSVARFLAGGRA